MSKLCFSAKLYKTTTDLTKCHLEDWSQRFTCKMDSTCQSLDVKNACFVKMCVAENFFGGKNTLLASRNFKLPNKKPLQKFKEEKTIMITCNFDSMACPVKNVPHYVKGPSHSFSQFFQLLKILRY